MIEFWSCGAQKTKRADLHIHSKASDGLKSPERIVDEAVKAGLSAIAFTDHDVINGGVEARDYCLSQKYPLEVIIGSEISSKHGHIIGLDLQEQILSGKSAEYTIENIHEQGGLAIAAHPFFGIIGSLGKKKTESIMKNPNKNIYLDGFEIFNGAVHNLRVSDANILARGFYNNHRKGLGAAIGGTDLHIGLPGKVETRYNGNIHEAILKGETSVYYEKDYDPIELYALFHQMFLGLVVTSLKRSGRYIKRQIKALA